MAKKSTVWRPTEAAAIGNVKPRPLPYLSDLYAMLAVAVRRHDRRGAQLLRHLLVRTMVGGEVGVR